VVVKWLAARPFHNVHWLSVAAFSSVLAQQPPIVQTRFLFFWFFRHHGRYCDEIALGSRFNRGLLDLFPPVRAYPDHGPSNYPQGYYDWQQ